MAVGPGERRIRTRTWTIKFSTPLHPSVGRGRRILKREALCRQLPLRFWRLEAGQNEEVLEVHSGFKEVPSGLKAALVILIGCRAGLQAFVEAAGGRAGGC